jgi:competence ComEA-like helix-hairpin-helix protein
MDRKIDINKAGPDEFEEVDGIDKEIAMQIVEFRHKNGDFQKLADLDKVPGIDKTRLHSLKSQGFVESAQISYGQCDCSPSSGTPSEESQSQERETTGREPMKPALRAEEIDMESIGEVDQFFQIHGRGKHEEQARD